MIVKNEEKHLERCLESVSPIVDEIIIVDTGSIDSTKIIASSFNAKVFDFIWNDDFSAARNFALEQSTSDWNLVLDADEYISNDCKDEIFNFIDNKTAIGRIKSVNKYIQDGEIKYSYSYLSRLIPKGIKFTGRIHEQVETSLPRRNVNIEVYHDGYVQTNKTERNLRLLLKELQEKPYDDYVLYQTGKQYKLNHQYTEAEEYFDKSYSLIEYDCWYKPNLIVDFLYVSMKNKSFKKGFGLIDIEKETLADFPDFHFVCGLYYMDLILHHFYEYNHLIPRIEESFLQCLAIGETTKYDTVNGTGSFLASYNLGVFYETFGINEKAVFYYEIAGRENYEPAIYRLKLILEREV
jgi:glycosyltransferase involved in cell wall biosynthesis